jgi:hypothetical protein
MGIGPSPLPRLEAERGYAIVGDYQRAHEVVIALARDVGAPPLVRGDAYRLLLRIVGNWLPGRGETLGARRHSAGQRAGPPPQGIVRLQAPQHAQMLPGPAHGHLWNLGGQRSEPGIATI